jgi:acyl dehydratase
MQHNHWQELIGKPLGSSEWFTVDQARIDAFAEVTLDRQYIHVDPIAAASTLFGGTVAHGLLIQSLLPYLIYPIFAPYQSGAGTFINYGSDKVRYLQGVRADAAIRCHLVLSGCEARDAGTTLLRLGVTIEIDGEARPAMIAEALTLIVER